MENPVNNIKRSVNRRSFMKSGLLAGGAATVGAGLLAKGTSARAQEQGALLMTAMSPSSAFVAAAELIESDLWVQYAELGGIGDNKPIEVDPNQPAVEQLPDSLVEPRWRRPAIHSQQHPG
jgi:hypothetical protein